MIIKKLADASRITFDGEEIGAHNLCLRLPDDWDGNAVFTFVAKDGKVHKVIVNAAVLVTIGRAYMKHQLTEFIKEQPSD